MTKKKDICAIILMAILCCIAIVLVDGVLKPGYAIKSAIKLAVFLLPPLAFSAFRKDVQFRSLFRLQRKGFALALTLGVGLYVLIVGGYFLLSGVLDLSSIAQGLEENAGVTRDNFLYVSLYISFVNSLLEEFFFRGFVFFNLKKLSTRQFAYLFSAVVFALYHAGMAFGMISPLLFVLMLVALTVGGMIFNYLNEKQETIYTSWLVHMFANFAINTIGFVLLNAA